MTNYKDYANSSLAVKWAAAGNTTHVPDSCCITMVAKCGMDQGTKGDASVIHTQVLISLSNISLVLISFYFSIFSYDISIQIHFEFERIFRYFLAQTFQTSSLFRLFKLSSIKVSIFSPLQWLKVETVRLRLNVFLQGCLTKLEDFVTDNLQVVGIVAIAFVVVEICNLIFAFWLYRRYK